MSVGEFVPAWGRQAHWVASPSRSAQQHPPLALLTPQRSLSSLGKSWCKGTMRIIMEKRAQHPNIIREYKCSHLMHLDPWKTCALPSWNQHESQHRQNLLHSSIFSATGNFHDDWQHVSQVTFSRICSGQSASKELRRNMGVIMIIMYNTWHTTFCQGIRALRHRSNNPASQTKTTKLEAHQRTRNKPSGLKLAMACYGLWL